MLQLLRTLIEIGVPHLATVRSLTRAPLSELGGSNKVCCRSTAWLPPYKVVARPAVNSCSTTTTIPPAVSTPFDSSLQFVYLQR